MATGFGIRLRRGENSRVVLGTAFGSGVLPTLSSRITYDISATVVSWNSVAAQVLTSCMNSRTVSIAAACAGGNCNGWNLCCFSLLEIQVNQTTWSLQGQIRIFSPHYPPCRPQRGVLRSERLESRDPLFHPPLPKLIANLSLQLIDPELGSRVPRGQSCSPQPVLVANFRKNERKNRK